MLLNRCLVAKPPAGKAKHPKSALKPRAFQGVLLFQSDGACPEVVLLTVEGLGSGAIGIAATLKREAVKGVLGVEQRAVI